MMSGLGLSSAQMSGPCSVDDKPNSDEKTELDQELEQLGAENEKIQILLEKFDQLQEVMIPERLQKFKETIDDHLKIFEAKMKKGINKKIDDNTKGITTVEKKIEKTLSALFPTKSNKQIHTHMVMSFLCQTQF